MTKSSDNSFFSEECIKTPFERLKKGLYTGRIERNNLILDTIRILYPISKYKLAKDTGLSYGTIKQVVKEFEFCSLVFIKIQTGNNGLPVKMIYLKHEETK